MSGKELLLVRSKVLYNDCTAKRINDVLSVWVNKKSIGNTT